MSNIEWLLKKKERKGIQPFFSHLTPEMVSYFVGSGLEPSWPVISGEQIEDIETTLPRYSSGGFNATSRSQIHFHDTRMCLRQHRENKYITWAIQRQNEEDLSKSLPFTHSTISFHYQALFDAIWRLDYPLSQGRFRFTAELLDSSRVDRHPDIRFDNFYHAQIELGRRDSTVLVGSETIGNVTARHIYTADARIIEDHELLERIFRPLVDPYIDYPDLRLCIETTNGEQYFAQLFTSGIRLGKWIIFSLSELEAMRLPHFPNLVFDSQLKLAQRTSSNNLVPVFSVPKNSSLAGRIVRGEPMLDINHPVLELSGS